MCILEGAAAQGEGEEEKEEENEEVKLPPKEPGWRTVCSDDPQDVWGQHGVGSLGGDRGRCALATQIR